MLELKDVTKDYLAGENTVHALKGINLAFRSSELVSILGPSGCGKTTMLNIIGGLDKYTSGDLLINGRSTKDFKDRDWDAYRNHSIGFVFQSYNLIPHQTVLQNVELALTLSGVSKAERRDRAKKALEDVGLGEQLKKRPSELSGGQMQRVAIARAIVNNPDIILADEPTGALDTETSIQVMDILKQISSDRLVIMVTHNPELASQYSTRIVKMLDGKILNDSMPLTEKELQVEKVRDESIQNDEAENKKTAKKPSMSWFTSFGLSLKNLFTKKGRTTLTAFAGSIGIIGIALIYAISNGLSTYIDNVQEETLSSYPLMIEETSTNLASLLKIVAEVNEKKDDHDNKAVYKSSAAYDIMNAFNNTSKNENDLKSFKTYLEKELEKNDSSFNDAINGIQYSYKISPQIYTKTVDNTIIHSDTSELMATLMSEQMGIDMSAMSGASASSGSIMSMGNTGGSTLWQEMLSGLNGDLIHPLLKEQYDLVYGSWPNEYNEVLLVLDQNNELNDITLYALGFETKDSIDKVMEAAVKGVSIEETGRTKWTYEEICNGDYHLIFNSDCYKYDSITGTYKDLRESEKDLQYLYDNGTPIKITGIIRPNEDATATMLTGSIAYTKALTEYVVNSTNNSEIIKAQLDNPETDILTNLPFQSVTSSASEKKRAKAFRDYISKISDEEKYELYLKVMCIMPEDQLEMAANQAMEGVTRDVIEQTMAQAMATQMSMNPEDIQAYISKMSDEEVNSMYRQMAEEQIKGQYTAQVMGQLSSLSPAEGAAALDAMLGTLDDTTCATYYNEVMTFSNSNYEDNLIKLGYVQLDDPSTIYLYATSFANKDVIEDVIKDYNKGKDDLEQIKYTDYVGLIMSSVTTILNAITYVLIAFVSISLIVSSIMIGVITLISVQERTKEIGILRSIGASKRNVSNMFNAETMLIGFSSGLLGVVVTYLLCIPINILIKAKTGIKGLTVFLPLPAALIFIGISVLLTLFAGIIPSRSAAKKDPVVALRTE
ncbi:MAG: ATP-binding cassette domain-containing protein [Lachnospiraceae bacterium]|nr:ATP-binding cassette domain-containing protein [Lachnospiraceae bacterium]